MNNLGDSKRGYFGVGSESAPSQTFSNEPVTGIYLDTPGSSSAWTVSKRGTKRLRIDDDKTVFTGPVYASGGIIPTGPFLAGDGSFSAPSYSFSSETAMGMYRDSPDFLAITNGTGTEPSITFNPSGTVVRGALTTGTGSISGGSVIAGNLSVLGTSSFTDTASFGSFGITSSGLIRGADGTISNPEYSFTNDTKMGMYRGGTNILNFSPGTGTLPMLSVLSTGCGINGAITTGTNSISGGGINGSSFTSTGTYQAPNGSSSAPAYTFTSSTGTGHSFTTAGTLSLLNSSVAGSRKFSVQTDLLVGDVGLSLGSNPMTCGNLFSSSITNPGTASFGGNMTCGAMTTGAVSSTSINNSGTSSFSGSMTTAAMTTGAVSSTSVTVSGALTCTNASGSTLSKTTTGLSATSSLSVSTRPGNIITLNNNTASSTLTLTGTPLTGCNVRITVGQILSNQWTVTRGSASIKVKPFSTGTTYSGSFTPGTSYTNIIFPTTSSVGDAMDLWYDGASFYADILTSSNTCTFS